MCVTWISPSFCRRTLAFFKNPFTNLLFNLFQCHQNRISLCFFFHSTNQKFNLEYFKNNIYMYIIVISIMKTIKCAFKQKKSHWEEEEERFCFAEFYPYVFILRFCKMYWDFFSYMKCLSKSLLSFWKLVNNIRCCITTSLPNAATERVENEIIIKGIVLNIFC